MAASLVVDDFEGCFAVADHDLEEARFDQPVQVGVEQSEILGLEGEDHGPGLARGQVDLGEAAEDFLLVGTAGWGDGR